MTKKSSLVSPEAFWLDNPTTTYWKLKSELNNQQRVYSVILVSTVGLQNSHGEQDFEDLSGGCSDRELVTSCKPFPREKILFAYKPIDEVVELIDTTQNPAGTYDNFISLMFEKKRNRYNVKKRLFLRILSSRTKTLISQTLILTDRINIKNTAAYIVVFFLYFFK